MEIYVSAHTLNWGWQLVYPVGPNRMTSAFNRLRGGINILQCIVKVCSGICHSSHATLLSWLTNYHLSAGTMSDSYSFSVRNIAILEWNVLPILTRSVFMGVVLIMVLLSAIVLVFKNLTIQSKMFCLTFPYSHTDTHSFTGKHSPIHTCSPPFAIHHTPMPNSNPLRVGRDRCLAQQHLAIIWHWNLCTIPSGSVCPK